MQTILSLKESLPSSDHPQISDPPADTANYHEEIFKQLSPKSYRPYDKYVPERLKDYRRDYDNKYFDKS